MGEMEMLTDDQIADAIPTSSMIVTGVNGKSVLMTLEDLREFVSALESRASNAGGAVYQALHVDTCTWEDVTAEYYTERLPSNRRILYTHPAPASKEPVADERAAEFDDLIDVYQSAQKDGSLDDRANARAALKSAYRAALATAQTPEGWKLVPVEPTEEMHAAAVRAIVRCLGNDDFPPRVYAAMLAAAPAKPEGV